MDLTELPIINPDQLEKNFVLVGRQLAPAMRKIALDFVSNNQNDASALGADTVKAILQAEIYHLDPLTTLPDDATVAQIADREEENAARTAIFQIVAAAQLQDSERVARLSTNAKSLLGAAFGIAAPLVFKAVLTKMAGG